MTTLERYREMPDEELQMIASKMNRKGLLTRNAEIAMKVLRERACRWDDIGRVAPSFQEQEDMYNGYSSSYSDWN